MWEAKRNSRYLSTGHRILPSCGCKARETMIAKYELVLLSAYDMKNIFCLFERLFKIQKNGVFLFDISFFMATVWPVVVS